MFIQFDIADFYKHTLEWYKQLLTRSRRGTKFIQFDIADFYGISN